jgi:hypothetical protein
MHLEDLFRHAVTSVTRRLLQGLCALPLLLSIASAQAAPCIFPDRQVAQHLLERWNSTLKSQHPDRVTRLFTADATMLGIGSPITRANYMSIRNYFVYFLQFEPQVAAAQQSLEFGCNFLVDHGSYVVTLKNRTSGELEKRDVRYSIMYEYVQDDWRIAQFIEALADGTLTAAFAVPPPTVPRAAATDVAGPAVAGFIKRAEPGVPSPAGGSGLIGTVEATDSGADGLASTRPRARTIKRTRPTRPDSAADTFGLDSFDRGLQ